MNSKTTFIGQYLNISFLFKLFLPFFFIFSGFVSGFFLKQYLWREECLSLAFSNNQEALSQTEMEEITKLLNDNSDASENSLDNNLNSNISNVLAPQKSTSQNDNSLQKTYVGSKNSDKFYISSCRYAKRIKEENLVWFDSIEEGEKEGRKYVDCGS